MAKRPAKRAFRPFDAALFTALRGDPPDHPLVAAFLPAIEELLRLLSRETRPARRERVLDEATRLLLLIIAQAQRGKTKDEQERNVRSLQNLVRSSGDYRRDRGLRLPRSSELLEEYEAARATLGRFIPARRSAKHSLKKLAARVHAAFPELTARVARDAAKRGPAGAAVAVVAGRYGISAERLEAKLTQARKLTAKALAGLPNVERAGLRDGVSR